MSILIIQSQAAYNVVGTNYSQVYENKLLLSLSQVKKINNIYLTLTGPASFLRGSRYKDQYKILESLKGIPKVKEVIVPSMIRRALEQSELFSKKKFTLTYKELSEINELYLSSVNARFFYAKAFNTPSEKLETNNNYNENLNLSNMTSIYDVYNFWVNFFYINKIDIIYYDITLHTSLDMLIIKAARKNNVKNIFGKSELHLNNRIYNYVCNYYNNDILALGDNKTKQFNSLNFDSVNNAYKNNGIDFQKTKWKPEKYTTTVRKYMKQLLRSDRKMSNLKYNVIEILRTKQGHKVMKKLKKQYEKIAKYPINTDKYMLYFIHYEPEASYLSGEMHTNQLLNIRILSSVLPEGWKLYVREHPAQFFAFDLQPLLKDGITKYKNKQYYDYINSIDNVRLISTDVDYKELITNAEIISSICGSVFLEAGAINKPCISFSKCHLYNKFNHVWEVRDLTECKKALKEIFSTQPLQSDYKEILSKYLINDSFTDEFNERTDVSVKTLKKVIDHATLNSVSNSNITEKEQIE